MRSEPGMVDISGKEVTRRVARATARIRMAPETLKILVSEGSPKGNVFETARVAGIMAAKDTPRFVPLCHPLMLNKVTLRFKANQEASCVHIFSEVVCLGRTGVEMEALAAVSAAALTIYDMMKWKEKAMAIQDIHLTHKSGGKTGNYDR